MRTASERLERLIPRLLALSLLALPLAALARGGGGERYVPDMPSGRGGGGGGDIDSGLVYLVLRLLIAYPHIMLPLLGVGAVAWYFYQRNLHPTGATQRAIEQREAELRTHVSPQEIQGWIATLRQKDPTFELRSLSDKVCRLFDELQGGWFRRDLSKVRPFLSDATWQRFNVQLQLLQAQGTRDAIADWEVMELELVGLDQSEWFDSLHIRLKARMRDTDVAASLSDEEATAAARRAPLEPFTEVWTLVRKPGVQTRAGQDAYQGKCPNCGAPFSGGATNSCEYCGAIVNSGHYDWTLAEITQGIEHVRPHGYVEGLRESREADPALSVEILEDRASLLFWRWVEAQSRGEAQGMSKVAYPEALARLEQELGGLRQQGLRRVFLDCAVGGVILRNLEVVPEGLDRAHVEIRWSARVGVGPAHERPPELPTVPQRWVFTLLRKHGARTPTGHGMSTDRCPQCHAPLTHSAATTCDYCGAALASGEQDWVFGTAQPYESWVSSPRPHPERPAVGLRPSDDVIADPQERQRLLYMMAAVAAADGEVSPQERKLLELCARRWSVPAENLHMALNAGPRLFDRLLTPGSAEAEAFLRHIVDMARVDGRIDRQERRMLEAAATHLGLAERLQGMLRE